MARLTRLAIDQQLHLIVHRAVDGVDLLRDDLDRSELLGGLLTVSRDTNVAIHAYVVLPDRVQLLLTPQQAECLSSMMQRLGRRFSGAYNLRHQVSGSPWAGRYRSTVLQPERHLLDAMRWIEAAPVRCGLIAHADEWPASSAAHHAGRRVDALVTEHPAFWTLGNTPFDREARYRHLLGTPLSVATVAQLEDATTKAWALGDAGFIEALTKKQARRLLRSARGRPRSVPGETTL